MIGPTNPASLDPNVKNYMISRARTVNWRCPTKARAIAGGVYARRRESWQRFEEGSFRFGDRKGLELDK